MDCETNIEKGVKNGKHVEKKGVNCLFDYNLADYRAALLSVMHFLAEYEGRAVANVCRCEMGSSGDHWG